MIKFLESPSSRGLGHHPLTVKTGVQIPQETVWKKMWNRELFKKMLFGDKIAVIAGGTGGHVIAAENFASFFDFDLFVEKRCTKFLRRGLNNVFIYNFNGSKFLMFLKMFFTFLKLIKDLWKYNTVILFGSIYIIPAFLAAVFLRKNIVIHEQNAMMGLTNRIIQPFAKRVLLSFKETKYASKSKSDIFGLPVTFKNFTIKKKNKNQKKYILVIAGSGGADFFDNIVTPKVVKFALVNNMKVFCQVKCYKKFHNTEDIQYSSFFTNIEELVSGAFFIINRSGAGSLALIQMYKKKAITIPWSGAKNNHQFFNGKASGQIVIEEKDIDNLEDAMNFLFYSSEEDEIKSDLCVFKIEENSFEVL